MRVFQMESVRLNRAWLRYYLLGGIQPRSGYGICVTCGTDAAFIPGIAASEAEVRRLLESMIQGRVTPVTARDVVEDWLCS